MVQEKHVDDAQKGVEEHSIWFLLKNWESKKVHFTIKDILTYRDFSLLTHPMGFLASIVLFPSYVLTGLNTSIQENMLLDFKQSLTDNDIFLSRRYSRIRDLKCATRHFQRALTYVESRANSEYLKLEPKSTNVDKSKTKATDDNVTESLVYYKRYLQNAIDIELYTRNPVKYDSLYPTTSVLSKVSLVAVSSTFLLMNLEPHIVNWVDEVANNHNKPMGALNSSANLTKQVGLVLWNRINMRLKAFLALAKYRKPVYGIVFVANVVNVVRWAFEERK